MVAFNHNQLSKLLDSQSLNRESIYGVIGRMEALLDLFRDHQEYRGLIPFLETYYLVTRAVADKRIEYEHYFQDQDSINRLDVYFASLYFEPLKQYLLHKKYQAPWQEYFKFCEHPGKHPFVQMLLGINAHINADLTICLVKLKYKNKHDFLIVNKILSEVTPHVMRYLAFHEHDMYGLGGMIFKKFVREEFHKTVVSWRKLSWNNASRITNLREGRKFLNKKTEDLGSSIAGLFDNIIQYKTPLGFTKVLSSLKINFRK